ncbi:DUF4271 domain-containing protein [uncultured Bacteroides sp.]|uniref:DUF4271 domain-containing protein n=1 Tax=uncultured Bacteroides sp. TaxID=162156 RepID=UPI003748D80B
MQADTLPLFYENSSDSIAVAPAYSLKEHVSGFEGVQVPYTLKGDDVVSAILMGCFLISAYVLASSKKYLVQQVKDFVLHRDRSSIFAVSTAADIRHLLLLILQTCVLSALCLFDFFVSRQPTLILYIPSYVLVAFYVGICFLYLLMKWLLYNIVGWAFFDKYQTELWMTSYATIIYYIGFILFFFTLFLVYFDLSLLYFVSISFLLIISTKILILYKWIKLFFNNVYGLFLLILYFCALEILPCIVMYRVLVQINNLLLIKF